MADSNFASLEKRLAIVEDKLNTLSQIVSKYGLLSPDVVELKLSVSALTLVVSDEAARSAKVEVAQQKWNQTQVPADLTSIGSAKD